jgi:Na+-driven multidrug efflux pump
MSGHVLRLSGFMIMGFLAMTLAQLVEAAYLGMVGRDELAAVAFAFPIVMLFNAATRGIGVGTGAVLARAIGRGDREYAARLVTHGLLLTLLFTLIGALLLIWYSDRVFALLGASGRVLELTVLYMSIWCLGVPAFGLSMVGSGLMRSIGDPAFPGYVMTTGSVLQVLAGPPLIFGWFGIPALGIEGAAWAFVIARTGSFCMTFWWFAYRERMLRMSLARCQQHDSAAFLCRHHPSAGGFWTLGGRRLRRGCPPGCGGDDGGDRYFRECRTARWSELGGEAL